MICFLQICQKACLGFFNADCTKGMAATDGGADASFLSVGCAALLLCLAEVCTTVLTVSQASRSGLEFFPKSARRMSRAPGTLVATQRLVLMPQTLAGMLLLWLGRWVCIL